MAQITRLQAHMHIRDVLTEFINMAQSVKDSGVTVNANGKRILDGLEIAKKALAKLEENYFAQLSDEGVQTFLDKCKIQKEIGVNVYPYYSHGGLVTAIQYKERL